MTATDRVPIGTPEERREARKGLRNVRESRPCSTQWEWRDVPNGTGGTDLQFTGYACVTDFEYEMEDWLGPWVESVSIGAFGKTLRESADVAFLINHEGTTLARTKSGTLKLSEQTSGTPTGLYSEARLDTSVVYVGALRSAIERGDMDAMSFAFRVTRQEWDEDYERRWINEVNMNLGDVSVVNFPANPGTSGTLALRNAGRPTQDEWRGAFIGAYREARAGKMISAANLDVLQRIDASFGAASDALGEGRPLLGDLIAAAAPVEEEDPAGDAPPGGGAPQANLAHLDALLARNRALDARHRRRAA